MSKVKRNKLKLNVKFQNEAVVCARSPDQCKNCKDIGQCEGMELFYNPFNNKDLVKCFTNDERRR